MIPECAKRDLWSNNNMRAKAESRESMTVMNSMQFQAREGKVKMLYTVDVLLAVFRAKRTYLFLENVCSIGIKFLSYTKTLDKENFISRIIHDLHIFLRRNYGKAFSSPIRSILIIRITSQSTVF